MNVKNSENQIKKEIIRMLKTDQRTTTEIRVNFSISYTKAKRILEGMADENAIEKKIFGNQIFWRLNGRKQADIKWQKS
jgi:predicted transcriptional regulator